jgi:GntR family transcriptional regulator, carbon starvation induced regulator
MTSTAPQTRADWVDDRLREAILAGELAPGEKLVAATLAARWSVSPTPLREAFQRLAAEGLVELRPQRGARVASASPRDAEEVYELRLILEPRALRDSLEHSDDLHRADIKRAHAHYGEALGRASTDLMGALDAHRDFHATLLARCTNGRLLDLVLELADHSQRFQVLAVGAPAGHHDVIAEHQTLCDDAVAGRVDNAVQHLGEHLSLTLDGVRANRS